MGGVRVVTSGLGGLGERIARGLIRLLGRRPCMAGSEIIDHREMLARLGSV